MLTDDLIHKDSDSATSSPEASPVISLADTGVQLASHTIWNDVAFEVFQGEFIAVLGPNGAGKSTLLRLLLGLVQPSRGKVSVLGSAPRRGNPRVGYVPQRRTLDPDLPVRGRDLVMLGLDGLRWGLPLPGSRRRQERAQVQRTLDAVEAGTYADRPIGHLSGGEQQRLLLAQALVAEPRLLLLDEPLSSLDLRSQVGITQLVGRLARASGITVLMVTHDINPVLPLVDRVIYVAGGRMIIGKPDEIITTQSLSELYNAPVEVVHDSRGRMFVVGLENEVAHPHAESEPRP